jgi:aspartate aminotransferase-like enzyme
MTNTDKPILMIPGPSEPYLEAHKALMDPVLPHYGSDWMEIYNDTLKKLRSLFGGDENIHIYPGTGTAVMEMGISSIIERGDKVVVVNRGFFANRFRDISEIYGAETIQVAPDRYGERVDIDELAYTIDVVKPKLVIVVHSETSTGLLEDIDKISRLIPDETYLFLDCISSFGALKLNCEDWGIDLCVGYSSKALGSINGVTPFLVSKKLWDYVDPKVRKPKSFTLDLGVWRWYVENWREHPYPVSLSTPLVLALRKACEIVLEEGIDNVERRHYEVSNMVKEWVLDNDFELIPRWEYATPTVTVFRLPEHVDSMKVASHLKNKYNIFISTTWLININGLRIGHMGYTAKMEYIDKTLSALEDAIKIVKSM